LEDSHIKEAAEVLLIKLFSPDWK